MKLAIFDFDGTLYPDETFPILMNHLKYHEKYKGKYKRFISKILPVYIAYKLKIYPEKKMKEQSMHIYLSVFHRESRESMYKYFSEIADQMKGNFNPTMINAIEKHRSEGYHIMLVSGAYSPLLEAVSKELKFDSIIGTNIPFENDFVEKKQEIVHVQGERKKQKVYERFLNDEIDWENSIAYGDSFSDLAILEMVGFPVAVNPESRLSEIANRRKWKIIQ